MAEELLLSEYLYHLPEDRIAQFPAKPRDHARLLQWKPKGISHHRFYDLPDLLPNNALLVLNRSKVIAARFELRRSSGAKIEVFLLKPLLKPLEEVLSGSGTSVWEAMVGNRKRWQANETLTLEGPVPARFFWKDKNQNQVSIELLNVQNCFRDLLQQAGSMPLPPYLNRKSEESDKEDYQTVFCREEGSVAAPTAGLHFTEQVLQALNQKGIQIESLVLHVGAGTFQPISTQNITEHCMHAEHFEVEAATLQRLAQHQGPIIPVGTTALRTLESLFWAAQLGQNQVPSNAPYAQNMRFADRQTALQALLQINPNGLKGQTSIYMYPGYKVHMADALITNFHQPGSTLMLLVAALIGPPWKNLYQEALNSGYRFLSYGDASLLWLHD